MFSIVMPNFPSEKNYTKLHTCHPYLPVTLSKKQNKINKQNKTKLIGIAHKQVVVGRGRVEIGEGD